MVGKFKATMNGCFIIIKEAAQPKVVPDQMTEARERSLKATYNSPLKRRKLYFSASALGSVR